MADFLGLPISSIPFYGPFLSTGKALYDTATGVIDSQISNDDNTLSQSRYNFNYRTFPNDLGMDYLGHYMVININVPTYPNGNPRSAFRDEPWASTILRPDEFSKVDVLRFGRNVNSGGGSSGTGLPRRTRRIVESIALFMPGSQLIFNGRNAYEEISLTAIGGNILTGAISAGANKFGLNPRTFLGGLLGNTASGIGNIVSEVGGAAVTGAQIAGFPINPRVEVLFATTPLRDFQFEFLMIPRNEEEAKTIKNIVRTLRFHAAPEIDTATFGNTFIPPAEFDITFFNRGVENLNIPRINTCVLLECEVDYAPNLGVWQAYRDGHPLATRLRLVFKEIEIVHKTRVAQGF